MVRPFINGYSYLWVNHTCALSKISRNSQ
jgi:hypothetical protein